MVRLAGIVTLMLLAAGGAWAQLRPMARPADLMAGGGEAAAVPVAMAPADALSALGPAAEGERRGRVTDLPLPRYVSLKGTEGNARRGPSLDYPIDWVFVRQGMPLRITDEYGHWRRIEDRDGLGGWVHYSLLSGTRTVIVAGDGAALRSRADERSTEIARLEPEVVARVETCEAAWCRLSAGGFRGWAPKTAIWGVGADEVLD